MHTGMVFHAYVGHKLSTCEPVPQSHALLGEMQESVEVHTTSQAHPALDVLKLEWALHNYVPSEAYQAFNCTIVGIGRKPIAKLQYCIELNTSRNQF